MKCIHGIDSRFCAACNRPPKTRAKNAIGDVTLEEVLRFLNEEEVRATYSAVGEILGVIARSMGARLGSRRPEASWIVAAETGLPTDYGQDQWHPALLAKSDVITSGRALALQMTLWRGRTQKG